MKYFHDFIDVIKQLCKLGHMITVNSKWQAVTEKNLFLKLHWLAAATITCWLFHFFY